MNLREMIEFCDEILGTEPFTFYENLFLCCHQIAVISRETKSKLKLS